MEDGVATYRERSSQLLTQNLDSNFLRVSAVRALTHRRRESYSMPVVLMHGASWSCALSEAQLGKRTRDPASNRLRRCEGKPPKGFPNPGDVRCIAHAEFVEQAAILEILAARCGCDASTSPPQPSYYLGPIMRRSVFTVMERAGSAVAISWQTTFEPTKHDFTVLRLWLKCWEL